MLSPLQQFGICLLLLTCLTGPSRSETETTKGTADHLVLFPQTWIVCKVINTVESSSKGAPLIGIVVQDVYEQRNGLRQVVIPRGTRVAAATDPGALRDRIEVQGPWNLAFADGRQVTIGGTACARDGHYRDVDSAFIFGPEDGSAGIKGQVVTSASGGYAESQRGPNTNIPSQETDGRYVLVPAGTEFYIAAVPR